MTQRNQRTRSVPLGEGAGYEQQSGTVIDLLSTQKNSWYGDVIDKRELIQCGGQVGFCNQNRTRSVPSPCGSGLG